MKLPFAVRIPACLGLLLASLLFCSSVSVAEELPKLGDSTSAVVSPEQEFRLGRAWLRQLRAQVSIVQDPMIHEYLYNLVYRLAANSEIQRPQLETVVINSPEINAFAVPGGIIGLNGGLLLNARSEDELAGVIAHELAHLSQRHFARALERSQNASWAGLAALLASVVIAATAGGDAGMAALATTQAAAIESQLRFSRGNEQEADRIGMQTLARSGMNPGAMADFFEALQRTMRYSEIPPEFLLTHPVTESRITDARTRAARLPAQPSASSLEFSLMKMRAQVQFARDTSATINDLLTQRTSSPTLVEPLEYGLACAYLKANRLDEAQVSIDRLLKSRPERISYLATKAEILNQKGEYGPARQLLQQALKYSPDNYVLTTLYASALIKDNQAAEAVQLLRGQLTQHEAWPLLWSLLAEAYGKVDDRVGVHEARAEFYFLHGNTPRALEQLQFALPLAEKQFQVAARISARMDEMRRSELDLQM